MSEMLNDTKFWDNVSNNLAILTQPDIKARLEAGDKWMNEMSDTPLKNITGLCRTAQIMLGNSHQITATLIAYTAAVMEWEKMEKENAN